MAQQSTGVVRPAISLVCGVLAVVLMPLSLVAVWATVMLTRTNAFVAEMAPVVKQPRVQEAVADGIVTGVLDAIDLRPPAEQVLEGPLREVAGRVVSDPSVATAWTAALRSTHRQLIGVLEGRADTGLDSRGRVTMTIPLELPQLEQTLSQVGVTDPEALRPTIVIPLVAASDLATVRRVYAAADGWGLWAPVLVVALALLAVVLARQSRAALGWVAFGWLIGAGALAVALMLGRGPTIDLVSEPVVRTLADTAYGISATWIYKAAGVAAGIAIVLLVIVGVSGRSRRA